MLPLRFAGFWLAAGLAGIGLLFALTLLPLAFDPTLGLRFLDDKSLHFLAFMLLMIWFCGVFRLGRTPWVALGLLAIGVLIEFLQGLTTYRAAELADAVADGGGIALGWALSLAGLRHWTARVEAWLPAGGTR